MKSESPQLAPEESLIAMRPTPALPWRMIWVALLLLSLLTLLAQPFARWLNEPSLHNPLVHLLVALSAAVLGVVLALLVLHVARRARDGRVFLIGAGFLSISSIFITHAIATPDVLMSGREIAARFSATCSLFAGSLFFAAGALNLSAATNARLMRWAGWLMGAFLIFWLCYNWVFLVTLAAPSTAASPAASYGAPAGHDDYGPASGATPPASTFGDASLASGLAALMNNAATRVALVALGVGLYAFAALRFARFYAREPSPFGGALVCGTLLFGTALLTQFYAAVYSPLFWLYHIQEFLGFSAISHAALVSYRRGHNNDSLLESMLLSGTRARLQAEYTEAMDALIDVLARGEQPTPQVRALLRERVGLADNQVRVFERAARAVADERRQRQEVEQLNATLRELEMYKTQLTQMVVHDLKNPLTALIAYLEVLGISQLSDDQQELLTGALRSSRNLSALIGDLLDIARLEEGQLELERSWFAVQDLLRDCADSMQIWLTQEHKIVAIQAPAASLLLEGDLRLLRRLIVNLISNAIKHTPPGTQIWLRAELLPHAPGQQPQMALDVADNGPGIPPERLARIFDRFGSFTAQPSGAKQANTGLGLTLCRLVSEAHGGSISVSSVPGQGATFRVLLPVTEELA